MSDYEYRFTTSSNINILLKEGWEPVPEQKPVYEHKRSLNQAYDEITTYVFLRRVK